MVSLPLVMIRYRTMGTLCFLLVVTILSVKGLTTKDNDQENPSHVAIPHDIQTAQIVRTLNLKEGEIVEGIESSPFSDYFAVLENGQVMTVRSLAHLAGQSFDLHVSTHFDDGARKLHRLKFSIKERSTMLRFLRSKYEGSVYENLPPGTELQGLEEIEAVGDDDVTYELLGGNGAFAIHQVGALPSIVTLRALDREVHPFYNFRLRAKDSSGEDAAEAEVKVTILDMNDHAPIFTQSVFYFFVPLNVSRFDSIGKVTAHDGDGDKVVYQLAHPSNVFTVVPQTGEVLLIDTPEAMVYELELEAHDNRKPTLYSDSLARVHIEFHYPGDTLFLGETNALDDEVDSENDDYLDPERIRRSLRRVKRGQLRHTKELTFSEADGAIEGKIVFHLEKEIQWETFKIRDPNPWVEVDPTGAVRVKKKWDYEDLGPEKTIDFWVTITNNDRNG